MNKRQVCFVFGAGRAPARPPRITGRDLVIAADGGYAYTKSAGIRTDVFIGDFDSFRGVLPQDNNGLIVRRLPGEKDQTDMLAALRYGLERGFECFHIYGGTGGRLDHTLANIQCLAFLVERGARGYLHDDGAILTAFRGEARLSARRRGVVSVFAMGGTAEGVWLSGLKYELKNARLTCGDPLGVSNEFTGDTVFIKAERGILLVVYPSGVRELEAPLL